MTDNPYQPPAARIGPEAEPGSVTPTPLRNATATASLACGAGSVLFSWLALGMGDWRSIAESAERSWLLLPAIVLAATSVSLGIIDWNSERWPRAKFGIVLSVIGAALTIVMTMAVYATPR